MVKISDENLLWSILSGKRKKITPPSLPLSKDEVLNDIGHILSIGNLILGANSVKVSYLIQ